MGENKGESAGETQTEIRTLKPSRSLCGRDARSYIIMIVKIVTVRKVTCRSSQMLNLQRRIDTESQPFADARKKELPTDRS